MIASPARGAFTGAIDLYTSLGATRDVARLQARFREHGIRRGPRVKHRQARSGWDSLTPTEIKVAALVEQGLSNPQIADKLFLSPRTVATHVSHILGKLDVNSRIDIAREAASLAQRGRCRQDRRPWGALAIQAATARGRTAPATARA